MRIDYSDTDDILVIHLSDEPVVKEISQAWNTHISYAQDGSVAEITVVDAHACGIIPGRYFPDTDTLYIELCKDEIGETHDLDEDIFLDVDASGQIVAVTFEHASKLTPLEALAA